MDRARLVLGMMFAAARLRNETVGLVRFAGDAAATGAEVEIERSATPSKELAVAWFDRAQRLGTTDNATYAVRFFEHGKKSSHDVFWGNFIVSATFRLKELEQQKAPGDLVTWLVYRPGYERRSMEIDADLLSAIQQKADALGVALFWFNNKQELINYLNTGRDRKAMPIADFEYFGHSNKACFMFDYSNNFDAMTKDFLHAMDLEHIEPSDFAKGATAKSWGCHSGEYYTAQWKRHFGWPMVGAIGKTDYSHGELPFLSSPGGSWAE